LTTALPQIPLVAAGGVTQQTALDLMLAGATAIWAGTDLIPVEAIERRQAARIKELALRFAGYVKEARTRIERARESAPRFRRSVGLKTAKNHERTFAVLPGMFISGEPIWR